MKLHLAENTVKTLKSNRMHPLFRIREDGLLEHIDASGKPTGLITYGKYDATLTVGTYLLVSLFSQTQGDILVFSSNVQDVLPVGGPLSKIKYWLTTPPMVLV